MTILNNTSDGLPPELLVLFRAVAYQKKIQSDDLIQICLPSAVVETNVRARLRGSLLRWTQLGLFSDIDGEISLDERFLKNKKETINDLVTRLPEFCRRRVFTEENSLPVWGDSSSSADFCRGIAWLLAQNIYGFPTTWDGCVDSLLNEQMLNGKETIKNDTRWTNLRFWARYLGFATGDSNSFQIDPTVAIKETLPRIFGNERELSAKNFIDVLSVHLPVLDFGVSRLEIEKNLNKATWSTLGDGQLSMSLSLALRRLDLNGAITLTGKADAIGTSFQLTGRNYRKWIGFEAVVWNGEMR